MENKYKQPQFAVPLQYFESHHAKGAAIGWTWAPTLREYENRLRGKREQRTGQVVTKVKMQKPTTLNTWRTGRNSVCRIVTMAMRQSITVKPNTIQWCTTLVNIARPVPKTGDPVIQNSGSIGVNLEKQSPIQWCECRAYRTNGSGYVCLKPHPLAYQATSQG